MEALCSPRISDSTDTILSCLRSLDSLLSLPWTRKQVANDPIVGIEILNVLHRLLLTRDSCKSQTINLLIVSKVLKSANEHLYTDPGFYYLKNLHSAVTHPVILKTDVFVACYKFDDDY